MKKYKIIIFALISSVLFGCDDGYKWIVECDSGFTYF